MKMPYLARRVLWAWLLVQLCRCEKDDGECRDHPRLGSACRNVHNLREWCDRSRLQDASNRSNLAQVCRATCGFCKKRSGKAGVFIDTGSLESGEKRKQPVPIAKSALTEPQEPSEEVLTGHSKPSPPEPGATAPVAAAPDVSCGQPPDYAPCLPLAFSNQFFRQCCQENGIGTACLQLCRYDVTVEEVQLAHAKQECPFSILPAYFTCASRTKNNTDCCRDTGILADTGPQCASFCDPVGSPFGGIGIRHLKCAMYLEEIMQCHWAGLR